MKKSRDTYHHGALRPALIEAAEQQIRENGLEKLSLRGVARAVGVDPSAVYKHFRSKDDLLHAISTDGFRALARLMEARMADRQDPLERFLMTGQAYVDFAMTRPHLFRTMFAYAAQKGDTIDGEGDQGRNPYEILSDALDALDREAPFAEGKREVAETIAWAGIHGLCELFLTGFCHDSPEQMQSLYREIGITIVTGLRNAEPRPTDKSA